ncbi:uncharacterized protein Z520_06246 [Fonsecaea multimorphosa CBS 102226]|uniref:Transcription elongation factor SPT4 n=1 Tax=Fonsecaea multimorphosa CBS 102226 TaxID=1442371 RepID=A0A0D2IMA9_9EURO|nr:uncharacterized protein Z520_06246 [Fonsecaea multimorphosa CBS 102226]KIX98166.1 hypothetical protein Z520_06246 [Fonsecaea multimorphosa CBS 102226]OAL24241.1 hypothetical protein AYO22_05901 [Fonsecaea multimorphosa]
MAGRGTRTRACMVCSIVQSATEFFRNGCPNCEDILGLRNSQDAIQECTSQVFEGLIAMGDPKTSWVARWQRLTDYVPGIYAVKVVGTLPREIIDSLEDNGIKYVPRDGTAMEEDSVAAS